MTAATAAEPQLGLAVSTIGRPALKHLLQSAAESTRPPDVVVIANQSGTRLDLENQSYPFELRVISSAGGVSVGRNDAVAAMGDAIDVLGFPNDHSSYPESSLAEVMECFAGINPPSVVACSLTDPVQPRLPMPPRGSHLDRTTAWRAIEPATFVRREAFVAAHAFRTDLGTGCHTPWQSGEGTDLLLRLIAAKHTLISRPDIVVIGNSSDDEMLTRALIRKHRGYARGTGFVYRIHGYPPAAKARLVLAPWIRLSSLHDSYGTAVKICAARSLGRLEGLLGRTVGAPLSPW
jgi:hypothetical protein